MDWATLPTIETPRLLLRSITFDDVDEVFAVFSDPQVMRYWSTLPLENKEAAVKLVEEIQSGFELQQLLKWGIVLPSENRLIGTVTLFHPDFANFRAELGYALGRNYWGRGYMGETLRAVLDYAFNTLHFHRIEADVDPRNTASLRTLERLGFQREGYLRERWHVGGETQDSVFYGLLKPEWQSVNLSA
jgi:[ribosomal protein S5]-alanine N-acetyltransferase